MRVIELFAGIGACSSALKRVGFKIDIVDAVEIDKYAIKSFNAIHGTNFEVQDITKWDKNFENIDLITHGSPCQDFSLAGKQAGGDIGSGTRSSLMYETIRIVEKIMPKYVLWENVKNVLSKKHKHNFDNYINIMDKLGYNSYYKVLNAKDYGIPQNRERVFTISIRKDIDKKDFKFPDKENLKLNLKDILEDQVEDKYYLDEIKNNHNIKENYIHKKYQEFYNKNGYIPEMFNPYNSSEIKNIAPTQSTQCGSTTSSSTILKLEEKYILPKILDDRDKGYGIKISDIYPTQRANRYGIKVIENNFKIRKLTPKECWRLMRI